MLIRIKKKGDGSSAFSIQRADGSTTWQRQEGALGQFFPRHDLTHYAVETALGRRQSFYGLVASGWELTDFEKPYPRGPLPVEALASEVLVGLLDQERAAGLEWTAAEVNRSVDDYFAGRGTTAGPPLTVAQLREVRARRAALFAQWNALAAGETLELQFPPTGP